MSFRDELIQVAAVAVSVVEDLDHGSTLHDRVISLDDVLAERLRQNAKWGPQHHDPIVWLAILAEEVGEAARELDNQRPLTDDEMTLVDKLTYAETVARRILKEAGAT